MGKRGKDKRTEENLKKFHDKINNIIRQERLSYVYINGIMSNYIISSKGILYKLDNGIINIVRPYVDKDLHERTCLNIDGNKVKKYIHVLVAEAFVSNPDNKPFVHHIDGNTLNNDFTNLMWVTRKEHESLTKELNQYIGMRGEKNKMATSTDKQISEAIRLLEENELYIDQIAKMTGLTIAIIYKLIELPNSWSYLKEGHDISGYNKFRRRVYTDNQKQSFIKLRNEHPEYSLKMISNILDIPYTNIKQWNRTYK